MTDAERSEAESAGEELVLWMRERYAAAALDAARCTLHSRGKNAEGAQLLHGRLTGRGYEAVILSRDGMTLLRVRYDEQEGGAQKETAEVYALVHGAERTVAL